jgi:hypothetical protein
MDLLLPKDGSIVIIDDKYSEAKPLLDILSKNGHPSIYFDGDLNNLPQNKSTENLNLQRVRIVFADIQLKQALPEEQYVSLIIEHLNSLISENNGPYVLIVWSAKEAQFADGLKERIEAEEFKRKPIAFIRLNKGDFFKNKIKENIDLDSFREEIETRFSKDDINFILEKIKESFPDENYYICDSAALKRISLRIRKELKNYEAFELLIKWEYLVNNAATRLTSEFAAIHRTDKYWDYNFRNIISRFAQAQVGSFLKDLDNKDFVKAAFKTINAAFSDYLDNEVTSLISLTSKELASYKQSGYAKEEEGKYYKILWNNYMHYELYIDSIKKGGNQKKIEALSGIANNDLPLKELLSKMASDYININPELNTKLNIDLKTQFPFQPGVAYEIILESESKRRFLKETYFSVDFFEKKQDNKYKFTDDEINSIKFIELEISPNCDFANNKWLKHRTVSGILYPSYLIKKEKIQGGDSIYDGFPPLKINGMIVSLVLSFKLLKSFDISKGKKRSKKFLFKIKEQPMADIITRMASHATRIGLIEFK